MRGNILKLKIQNRALRLGDQLIPYEIQHKPAVKRRIHLNAAPDGTLLVIAPRRMSQRAIHKMLQDRVRHVARYLDGARERLSETPVHEYIDGERHLFMGELLPLEVTEAAGRGQVDLVDDAIRIVGADVRPGQVKNLLEAWYRARAAEHFLARLILFSGKAAWVDVEHPPMRLRKMKRTWGSCSAKGNITLNTRLIKAPPDCIDYVIAHELCHLREMNHGKAFYALQSELYPEWSPARSQLQRKAHVYLVD